MGLFIGIETTPDSEYFRQVRCLESQAQMPWIYLQTPWIYLRFSPHWTAQFAQFLLQQAFWCRRRADVKKDSAEFVKSRTRSRQAKRERCGRTATSQLRTKALRSSYPSTPSMRRAKGSRANPHHPSAHVIVNLHFLARELTVSDRRSVSQCKP